MIYEARYAIGPSALCQGCSASSGMRTYNLWKPTFTRFWGGRSSCVPLGAEPFRFLLLPEALPLRFYVIFHFVLHVIFYLIHICVYIYSMHRSVLHAYIIYIYAYFIHL